MAIKDEKDLARAIDDAGRMSAEIKRLEKPLEAIKGELTTYCSETGLKAASGEEFDMRATFADAFADIPPIDLFTELERLGKSAKFFDVVKVNMKLLGEIMAKDDIAKLRGEPIGTKISFRFPER